jgi:hypothetical protein
MIKIEFVRMLLALNTMFETIVNVLIKVAVHCILGSAELIMMV